ncbi:MAG TPA: hypothetical protein VM029_03785 [Opitutaceae bacterium]|nr:hypothetical protein [Opitutaceae bacterium]
MNERILQSAQRRVRAWSAVRCALLVAGSLGGLALAALLLDAAVDLPDHVRAFAPWLLATVAAIIVIVCVNEARRLNDRRLAKLFERNQPRVGDQLTNAVELAQVPGRDDVGEFLRLEAVRQGRTTAAGLRAWPLVRRSIQFASLGLAGAVAAWLLFIFAANEVARAVWPRFLDPSGDHPPFSRLHIEVTPRAAEVLYGGQIEVRATAAGRSVEKLFLVAEGASNITRTVMFLAPDRTFFQSLANVREPMRFYVTDGQARSRRWPLAIRYTPQITLVEITTTFPAYTGKAPRTAKLAEEVIALPEDTRVTFRVVSNRPLRAGELTLTPVLGGAVRQVALAAETNASVVSGSFQLDAPTAFTLSVRDVEGLASTDARQGRFNVMPDERPRLSVMEPARDAVATPEIRVPVRVQAEDDYGVARVLWLRGHNRSIERPFDMKVELKNGPASVEAAGAFDLAKLGVRPGDVIEYYFEAADNYPKGPNLALSRMYRLQVISQEQYEQVLRQAAARQALFEPYFKMGAWLRRLAERARDAQDAADSSEAAERERAAKEAQELVTELQRYREELGKIADQAIFFDIEKSFQQALAMQDTAVGAAAEKLKKAAGGGQSKADALREVARQLSRMSAEEQRDITEPARELASVAQLIARADVFTRLAREEATVARLLERFARQTNALTRLEQIEVQELAHQQRRLREELRKLLDSLPEMLAQVPAEPQYDALRKDVTNFLNAVSAAKIEDDMAAAAKSLAESDAMTGQALAQVAAEKMDRLIAKCQGLSQQGQQCLSFRPSVSSSLGNSLAQILAAMGAGPGGGEGGRDGYGMFNDQVALYGPNVQLAGQQAGGRAATGGGRAAAASRVTGDANDPALNQATAPGRVRLQPDAKFPLQYRDIVGEYFKAIAETEERK